ncbi:MAG: N,N-dimethylformamidase beta subunit family domain-containing protein [Bryobacteraceae bacterium]
MSTGRRDLLKGALLAASGSLAPAADTQLIRRENQKSGARDWQLTRLRLDKRNGFRSPWIEGYCSHQSIEAGQTLRIFASTNPPARFNLEIFRMGYYGGLGARLMTTLGPFAGKVQPDPEIGARRLRECRWEATASLTIPKDWVSGVYLGRLNILPESKTSGAWQSYIVFIVRDRRRADVLFQCSDNTWQAYNRWPDDYSLYTSPAGSLVGGVDVSFDRPYGKYAQIFEAPQSVGSGEFLLWEFPLAYWLEQHGYDVTYCSNSDMLDPECAPRAKTFLSVGHDEYWDLRQYENAKAAIGKGTSEMYLSGNSVCFVAPFRSSADNQPNRIITRAGRYGGLSEEEKRNMGPFEVEGPNENLLMGARTIVPFNGGGDWIVSRPDHWIFEGTGVRMGDRIPGLVGWEFHGDPAALPGLEIVADGIALSGGTRPAHWTATVYPGPAKNFVFNAATIFWAQGLSSPPGHMLPWSHWSRPHGPDPRVQRITQNVLRRAIG